MYSELLWRRHDYLKYFAKVGRSALFIYKIKLHMNHKQIPEYLRIDNPFSSVGPSVKSDQRDFLCSYMLLRWVMGLSSGPGHKQWKPQRIYISLQLPCSFAAKVLVPPLFHQLIARVWLWELTLAKSRNEPESDSNATCMTASLSSFQWTNSYATSFPNLAPWYHLSAVCTVSV